MTELNLTEGQCFQKEEKIYKIIEIESDLLKKINFIDIELKEHSIIQQDFIVKFGDSLPIESNYFDQKVIKYNENKITKNINNQEIVEEIKIQIQKYFPDLIKKRTN